MTIRGELAAWAIARHPCIRQITEIRTHDAIMRIAGAAPRWRAHSDHGRMAMLWVGLPPPRIIVGRWRPKLDHLSGLCLTRPGEG